MQKNTEKKGCLFVSFNYSPTKVLYCEIETSKNIIKRGQLAKSPCPHLSAFGHIREIVP